ncbi:hypothetical protein VEJY3_02150 [Vibrio sp. EJY3]|nr:hypothetical protein VEJY3_02150 [Vibrio sp. EJY3]
MLLYMIDLFGTAIFAISGVLLAGRLKMDPFGVIVLGSVTAIGGGTIRDMALGATPVFWVTDPTYLWVIFITCLLTMLIVRRPKRLPWWVLPVCDAIGLAVFVGIGVEKALAYNASGMVAVIMGVITGCGGGIIRDVLAREVPMVLRSEVYATACIIGGIFHTTAIAMGYDHSTALIACVSSTLIIRLGAIRWHLSLPTFAINR